MNYAPIIIFCYNRLDHLQRVINALKENSLAKQSTLYIFSDGYKNTTDKKQVLSVRSYLRSIDGFNTIQINESANNKGLAASIIEGVTSIINQYEKVIVLEDDCVVSPYFLDFMNNALNTYQHDENVMHVNGYIPKINTSNLPETFFIHHMFCWGWGTWKNSWDLFEKNPGRLLSTFNSKMKYKFDFNGNYDAYIQIIRNHKRQINTWAVFWSSIIFINKGFCLTTKQSLIQNIGTDASGESFQFFTNKYDVDLYQKAIAYFPEKIEESQEAYDALVEFYKSHKLTYWGHVKSKTKKIFKLFFKSISMFH
tara:strand:+ start:622 stop:1551 length:930 start_codon:yes stop_codon:yes gene_type:complete